ncbi:MAG: hypothetical protein HXX81_07195 [Campylobacterales bacterium]|nr:hypothetical protein [Campylobacterales bacterium]
MKLYKTTIKPTSNFATNFRGDTLFGQICWGIKYLYGKERLENLVAHHKQKPFLICSDGFKKDFLPKPKLPKYLLTTDKNKKSKELKKEVWIAYDDLIHGNFDKAIKDDKKTDEQLIMHNKINRLSGTTGGNGFDPFGVEDIVYSDFDVYFLIDEDVFKQNELKECLEFVANHGYGKDVTWGKGRFEFENFENVDKYLNHVSNTYMSLNDFNANNTVAKEFYYDVFVRFGKMGFDRANKNPFKKPIMLADFGAVMVFDELSSKNYVGSVIENISTVYDDVIHQGYAIAISIKGLS